MDINDLPSTIEEIQAAEEARKARVRWNRWARLTALFDRYVDSYWGLRPLGMSRRADEDTLRRP